MLTAAFLLEQLCGPDAKVFGLPEAFVRAAVVMAVMPPGVNGYVFAAMYGRAVSTAASAVILGTVLFGAAVFVAVNLLVDLLYTVIDPRLTGESPGT